MLKREIVAEKTYNLKCTPAVWAILDRVRSESGQSYRFVINEIIKDHASFYPISEHGIEKEKLRTDKKRGYLIRLTQNNWDYLDFLKKSGKLSYRLLLNKIIEDYATRKRFSKESTQKAQRVKKQLVD